MARHIKRGTMHGNMYLYYQKNYEHFDVLAFWFKMDENGCISSFNQPKCEFIPIENYCASLSFDVIEKRNEEILISEKHLSSIKKLLKSL